MVIRDITNKNHSEKTGTMSDTSLRVQKAYNEWAAIYDTNNNPTRDLNYKAIREESLLLSGKRILELGCGTGLNTNYLVRQAKEVVGVDLSEEMLSRARQRIGDKHVRFIAADITSRWDFDDASFDFMVANLVLEHVENLAHVFQEASRVLRPGGQCYIAELHPYKQLRQSQAKFTSRETGREVRVDAFTHMISEYVNEGIKAGLTLLRMKEWQKEDEDIPRLLTFLLQKKE